MKAQKCRICGEHHRLGPCPPSAYGKPGFQIAAEALGITEPPFIPRPLPILAIGEPEIAPRLAPHGKCASCDRRRAELAKAVRDHRARKIAR